MLASYCNYTRTISSSSTAKLLVLIIAMVLHSRRYRTVAALRHNNMRAMHAAVTQVEYVCAPACV